MRPHPRGAEVDTSSPRAWASCDGCGLIYNLYKLSWQMEFTGTALINKRTLKCFTCLDVPQRQLGTIMIPPDPPAVMNARPENYPIDEVWPRMVEISMQHGSLPRYLEASTSDSTTESIGRALETSTTP